MKILIRPEELEQVMKDLAVYDAQNVDNKNDLYLYRLEYSNAKNLIDNIFDMSEYSFTDENLYEVLNFPNDKIFIEMPNENILIETYIENNYQKLMDIYNIIFNVMTEKFIEDTNPITCVNFD